MERSVRRRCELRDLFESWRGREQSMKDDSHMSSGLILQQLLHLLERRQMLEERKYRVRTQAGREAYL